MLTAESSRTLAHLFAELVDGVTSSRGGFMLNTGDPGMLASLDKLSADDASRRPTAARQSPRTRNMFDTACR